MRLGDLNYFLVVARTGNLGLAAKELGLTQPALTKAVQRLESDLGLRLFERTRRGMLLTGVGDAFFRSTARVGVAFNEAVQEARDLHFGEVGVVRVGVVPPFAEMLFSPACSELVMHRPAATVRVMINLNHELLSALSLGELDVVLSPLPEKRSPELAYETLFEDEWVIAGRDRHPLLGRRNLRFEDIAKASWVLPAAKVQGREWLERCLQDRNLPPPRIAVENNSSVAYVVPVVRNSNFLTVIAGVVLRSPAGQGLTAIPHKDAVWRRDVGISTRRAGYQSPLVQYFIDILRRHAASFSRGLSSRQSVPRVRRK